MDLTTPSFTTDLTTAGGCENGTGLSCGNITGGQRIGFGNTGVIVTTTVVGVGMIGIGMGVNYKDLWYYIKRPKAYLFGVFLQLFLVPLIAWAMAKAFQMPQAETLGVMIQGSSPGGSVSNIVVYWVDGVVDLSVAMTTTSTILALGSMPMWLIIFQTAENLDSDLEIPFEQLGITLASLVGPLAVGILLNAKFQGRRELKIASKIALVLASLGILAWVIYSGITVGSLLRIIWQQAVVAFLMPIVVFLLAYGITLIPFLGLNRRCKRTVSVECALQNSQVATSIINLSFANQPAVFARVILFPAIYYVITIGYSAVGALVFKLGLKKGWIAADDEDVDRVENLGGNAERMEKMGENEKDGKSVEKVSENEEDAESVVKNTSNAEFRNINENGVYDNESYVPSENYLPSVVM